MAKQRQKLVRCNTVLVLILLWCEQASSYFYLEGIWVIFSAFHYKHKARGLGRGKLVLSQMLMSPTRYTIFLWLLLSWYDSHDSSSVVVIFYTYGSRAFLVADEVNSCMAEASAVALVTLDCCFLSSFSYRTAVLYTEWSVNVHSQSWDQWRCPSWYPCTHVGSGVWVLLKAKSHWIVHQRGRALILFSSILLTLPD